MTDEEARVLAWTLLGEAAGEGVRGMTAVAHVIRNRTLSGRYPTNPATVALQSNTNGIYQFSTWNAVDQGGNLPRARYSPDSQIFNRALGVVRQVFGGTPGTDPTRGATHYYSPKGMGGEAPYWWSSEARHGELRIGAHVFAPKREEKVAPTPATMSVQLQEERLRGGAPIVSTQTFIYNPETQALETQRPLSVKEQEEQLRGGAEIKSTTDFIYDPVTQSLKPKTPNISDLVRAAGSARAAQTQIPTRESVAGFSVPGGTAGIATVDRARALQTQVPSYAALDAAKPKTEQKPKPNTATVFAQPAGSINENKDQSRLPAGQQPAFRPNISDLVRAAGAARVAAQQTPLRVAPVPMPPIQRAPVPVVAPPTTPLRITVTRDPVVPKIAETPKLSSETIAKLQGMGFSGETTYDPGSGSFRTGTSGYTVVTSGGGQVYDPRSGNWV